MPPQNDKRKRHATGKRTPGIFYRLDRHGDRAYEITWRTSDGKQHWQRVHGNLDDAKDALASKRQERKATPTGPARSFEDVVTEYKASADFTDLKASTRSLYDRNLSNYVLPTFEGVKLSAISSRMVADWLKGLRTVKRQRGEGKGLSAWTRRGALTTLRVVLRFATDEGYISSNPVDSLSRRQVPETDQREVRVLDGAELKRLIDATPERSRLMVTVKALTGLRSSELRGLVWTDIDLEAGKLTVQRQIDHEDRGERVALKTPSARRTRPLPASVVDALRDLHAQRSEWGDTDGFVFQRDGRPVAHGQLADDFKAAVKAAGIDDHDKRLTPHSLRHGYGSMLIGSGENVVDVSRALGHASVAITLRVYSHEFESHRPETDERALAAIEAFTASA